MAQKSWFFNSAIGDPRVYQASDFAHYFGKVLSTGLLHDNNVPGLEVSAGGTNLTTLVAPGSAIMEGYAYENTGVEQLSHSVPEITLDRIDRVVLRLDKKNANRYIKLFVIEGEPSLEPVAPSLQRNTLVWELSLAQVRIRANTAAISPADVLDERMNREVAGLVYSLISKPSPADIQTGGYEVVAETNGQTDFVIPLPSFDKVGDGLTVFVDGDKAALSSYDVVYPRIVRFKNGLPAGTRVEFDVIRGVVKIDKDYLVRAGNIGIADPGGYFESENVEGALQKIGLQLFKPKPTIYGIEIDENNPNPQSSVRYIDDSVNMTGLSSDSWSNLWPFNKIKPCVVQTATNRLVSYLNPNNFNQKEDGSPIDVSSLLVGDVFIEIPLIWVNITRQGTRMQIRISSEKVDDTWFAMAHQKGDVILPNIYIGAYNAYKDVDNKFRSLSNKVITLSSDLSDKRQFASNNNCDLANYYQRIFLPNILFWMKYKTRDNVTVLGTGALNYPDATGKLNTVGMDSNKNNGSIPNTPVKFLGLEHVYLSGATSISIEFIEGISFDNSGGFVRLKTSNYVPENTGKIYEMRNSNNFVYPGKLVSQTQGNAQMGLFGLLGEGSSSTHYVRANQEFGVNVGAGSHNMFSLYSGFSSFRIIYRPLELIK